MEFKLLSQFFQKKTYETVISGTTLVSATGVTELKIDSTVEYIAQGTEKDYVFKNSRETLKKITFSPGSHL